MSCPSSLSKRAKYRLAHASCLAEAMCSIYKCQYTTEDPHGPVSLGVAENALMHYDLQKFCKDNIALDLADFTYGTSIKGSKRLFAAFQHLFAGYFNPHEVVQPEQMMTGCGVGALLEQLLYLLCDEGDGVMIATPYYAGFPKEIKARNNAVPIDVQLGDLDPTCPETIGAFEEAYDKASSAGGPAPKVVILCNPHNPLGLCYPKQTLLAYLRFCQRHDLHLVVDEIYALSTYASQDCPARPFISILSIDVAKEADCDPSRVHMLYGASKDFCANGFRLGVLVTQHNPSLLEAFTSAAMWLKVSSPADALLSCLINNKMALEWFLQTNSERISEAYSFATAWLRKNRITYLPAHAGHFVFISLRPWLPQTDTAGKKLVDPAEQEAQLWMTMLSGGVYLAPGAFYAATEAGWFRLTFTVHRQVLCEGFRRLESILGLRAGEPSLSAIDSVRFAPGVDVTTVTKQMREVSVACTC